MDNIDTLGYSSTTETGAGPDQPPGRCRCHFADSSCIAFRGTGQPNDPVIAEPVVDPAACNALRCTQTGLLVPAVDVRPAPTAARSVDIDITRPATGECPQTWQIGARLSPVYGQVHATAHLVLTTAPLATWIPVPGAEITLPQAGVYHVIAEAAGQVTQDGLASQLQSISIAQRLFNITAGAAVPTSERNVVALTSAASGRHLVVAVATRHTFMTITGPTTIRLEGIIRTAGADTRADPCRIFDTPHTWIHYIKIAD